MEGGRELREPTAKGAKGGDARESRAEAEGRGESPSRVDAC